MIIVILQRVRMRWSDELLISVFVNKNNDPYKILINPKVNEFFKWLWFDGFQMQYAGFGSGGE